MNIIDLKKDIYQKLQSVCNDLSFISKTNIYNTQVSTKFNYDKPFIVYLLEGTDSVYTMKEYVTSHYEIKINFHSKKQTHLDKFYNKMLEKFISNENLYRLQTSTEFYNPDIEMHQLTIIYTSLP